MSGVRANLLQIGCHRLRGERDSAYNRGRSLRDFTDYSWSFALRARDNAIFAPAVLTLYETAVSCRTFGVRVPEQRSPRTTRAYPSCVVSSPYGFTIPAVREQQRYYFLSLHRTPSAVLRPSPTAREPIRSHSETIATFACLSTAMAVHIATA